MTTISLQLFISTIDVNNKLAGQIVTVSEPMKLMNGKKCKFQMNYNTIRTVKSVELKNA